MKLTNEAKNSFLNSNLGRYEKIEIKMRNIKKSFQGFIKYFIYAKIRLLRNNQSISKGNSVTTSHTPQNKFNHTKSSIKCKLFPQAQKSRINILIELSAVMEAH